MLTNKFFFLLIFSFAIVANLQAQRGSQLTAKGGEEVAYVPSANFEISADRKSMSEGLQNALTLQLTGADEKMVSKLWAQFAKDEMGTRPKYDRKAKQYVMSEASISGRTTEAYTVINERGNNSELVLWVRMEGDNFLNSYDHTADFDEAKGMLEEFAMLVERAKVENEIELEEKVLKQLERDLSKLENEKQRAERDIEKAKELIRESEAAIEQNLVDQETKNKEIETQLQAIDKVRKKLKKF